jgi:hypothetical protein
MSLKKTVAIAAAVGALAAISVPAMAMENEFHGTYTFNGLFSNFQDGGSGDFNPAFRGQASTLATSDPITGVVTPGKPALQPYGHTRQTNNYFEQRGRLQYTAKVSDDLKLVTQFELDTRFGGITDGKYTNSSDAGVLDADGINFETKHIYLDFNLGSNFNTKLGVQPYKDTLKGIFVDADLPAIMTTTKLGAYTLGVGYSRYSESLQTGTAVGRLGDLAKDLFILDNTFAITKDTKVGLSYYLLADYQTVNQASLINTLGASAETKVGPLSLSGFAAMQAGHQRGQRPTPSSTAPRTSKYFHGFAANVAAKLAVGPGTAKAAALFVSGNNNSASDGANDRGWQTVGGVNSYNEGGMMILVRATQNSPTSTDRYIRKIVTNVALATFGYDANLTDKVFANGNIGLAWAPASASATLNPNNNGGDYMGTEFNLEAGYKVNSNLTLRAQAAYAVLGAYYTKGTVNSFGSTVGVDPENPYTMRILASLKF